MAAFAARYLPTSFSPILPFKLEVADGVAWTGFPTDLIVTGTRRRAPLIIAGLSADLHQRAATVIRPPKITSRRPSFTRRTILRTRYKSIDGHKIEEAEGRLHPPAAGDIGVDGEDRLAGQQAADQHRVEERGVVDDDHRRILAVAVLVDLLDMGAEQELQQPVAERLQKFVRHQAE